MRFLREAILPFIRLARDFMAIMEFAALIKSGYLSPTTLHIWDFLSSIWFLLNEVVKQILKTGP